IPKGSVCNKLASSIDILPTLAAITGADLPAHKIDGVNILPLLQGNKDIVPRHEFYYYYQENDLEAVQQDHWKLVFPHSSQSYENQLPGNDGWPGPLGRKTVENPELYDLRRDPGERYNVIKLYPDKVKELGIVAEKARKDLGDNLTNNPGSNRRKPGSVK
ncbi:MAG TPA: arylsulfatase, partial [Bacteroidales bacterium]|nr:arylsulfatase [Bacteroidales bacterium]